MLRSPFINRQSPSRLILRWETNQSNFLQHVSQRAAAACYSMSPLFGAAVQSNLPENRGAEESVSASIMASVCHFPRDNYWIKTRCKQKACEGCFGWKVTTRLDPPRLHSRRETKLRRQDKQCGFWFLTPLASKSSSRVVMLSRVIFFYSSCRFSWTGEIDWWTNL